LVHGIIRFFVCQRLGKNVMVKTLKRKYFKIRIKKRTVFDQFFVSLIAFWIFLSWLLCCLCFIQSYWVYILWTNQNRASNHWWIDL